ncbi:MAG TPA: AAA family ATPase [Candidatus Saccharimonadales bacterium]
MDVKLDLKSTRAAKARLAIHIDKFWRNLLSILALILLIAGFALVFVEISAGWLLAGLAVVPAMIVEWWNGELKNLAPTKNPKSVADVLDMEILGRLHGNPNARDLATVVGQTNGGQFFGARFGLTAGLIQDIANDENITLGKVLEDAVEIRDQLDLVSITPGILVAAFVKQFPNYDAFLAHAHIEFKDILEGIKWQEHLKELIAFHAMPKRTGGLARDWSFGYIPLLSRFGQNISMQVGSTLNVETDSHKQALDKLVEQFSSGGTQNAVLVGPTGVGKTTLVYAFAEKLLDASSDLPSSLKFRQVIMLDAASLIAAAPGRGEIESLIMEILGEAYAAKNIIVCLDNAQLFFEDGVGSVDIANVLLPILEAGRLRMLLTMDEQRYLQISARNSSVANALNRISISSSSQAETMRVMQDQLILTEFKQHVTYTYQSLAEAYRLGERYVHDMAMPGQALKLLESAARYSEDGLVTINSVQQAIEQTMDIKVSVASETEDREKLLNLESLIHERMIGQKRAVEVVSDALRRARAGVRNQNRPIGTFLFLGPTGVGKTELSKALADVYFGGEDRMIRLDLNEYVRNEDVARLIADGATDPTSLTAQAMKQPYSVILLDEIEKAHPNVLTTLLQLLDEGILRDINNREVSFRDAIVIATSNAGADRIREYIERGYKVDQFEQQFLDELISSNQFRPEFLNRFDEIVTFTPLSKSELLQVVDLMIGSVNKTLELQKIKVDVAKDAKELLVERGYDPRLGARPMRRVIQKSIENTVAKLLLSGAISPGTTITINREKLEQTVGTIRKADDIRNESAV